MNRNKMRGWLLALPALIALGVGYLLPLAIALYKSLFAGMSTDFVGLENYADLFGNYAFGLAAKNLLRLWCSRHGHRMVILIGKEQQLYLFLLQRHLQSNGVFSLFPVRQRLYRPLPGVQQPGTFGGAEGTGRTFIHPVNIVQMLLAYDAMLYKGGLL